MSIQALKDAMYTAMQDEAEYKQKILPAAQAEADEVVASLVARISKPTTQDFTLGYMFANLNIRNHKRYVLALVFEQLDSAKINYHVVEGDIIRVYFGVLA